MSVQRTWNNSKIHSKEGRCVLAVQPVQPEKLFAAFLTFSQSHNIPKWNICALSSTCEECMVQYEYVSASY